MYDFLTTISGAQVADAATRMSPVATFVGKINRLIINPLIVLMFAAALAFFLYGVMQFFADSYFSPKGDDKQKKAKGSIMWGLIGMTIMFGVYGIIRIIESTLGVTNVNPNL
jgi:hypothetical protein